MATPDRAPVLVLGLGNTLLGDEGVGVHAVKALVDRHTLPDDVEVVDGGTSGMELLDIVAGRETLIVCDAVHSDRPPGTVIRLTDDEVPAFFRARVSPHQLGLAELLATLALVDQRPAHITVIGIVPRDIDLGTDLSDDALRGLEQALALIVNDVSADAMLPPRVQALVDRFSVIDETAMQGLPVCNGALAVEAVGFRRLDADWFGVLITPWFMNAILLPAARTPVDWEVVGDWRDRELPAGSFRFARGGDEEVGCYDMLSLHSPMFAFADQAEARRAAQSSLKTLLTEPKPPADRGEAPENPGRRALLLGQVGDGPDSARGETLA